MVTHPLSIQDIPGQYLSPAAGYNGRFLIIFLRTLRQMLGSISNDASKFFAITYSLTIIPFHVNNMGQFHVIK